MSMGTDGKLVAWVSHGRMLLSGLLVLASLIFLSWGCGSASPAPASPTAEPGAAVEHSKGNRDARVVIEEWTDLQ